VVIEDFVLYAFELINFIYFAGSFWIGETNATAGVLCGCNILLVTHRIYHELVFKRQSPFSKISTNVIMRFKFLSSHQAVPLEGSTSLQLRRSLNS
jgi:hypothetical protein